MVKIKVNDQNIVTGYVVIGEIADSVEVELEEIPDDLAAGYWKYEDGELFVDQGLKDNILNAVKPPTMEERLEAAEQALLALMEVL